MQVKWSSIKESLFSNRSLRQTVAKNTFWLTAGNVTGRIIKAGLIIYVARVLGAAGYGVALIYPPAAWIVGGVVFCAVGLRR